MTTCPGRSDQEDCCPTGTATVQTPRGQTITGAGPTVTEVDDDHDEDRLDFLGGPNPHEGPPNGGTGQATSKGPRVRKQKVIAKRK